MNVRTIQLGAFMSHGMTTLDLPDKGLVVVTGENGSGKSSLVEGVAVAFWGRTLRGTDPWRDDTVGFASAQTDVAWATRSVSARGSKQLQWGLPGAKSATWETPTKAQAALEALVGELEVWRRTHVFSSQDAAHFTLATDGERKRLLESILGLDRFDQAYESARADLRAVESKAAGFVAELTKLRERIRSATNHLAQIEAAAAYDPEPGEPSTPTVHQAVDLDRQRSDARAALRDVATEYSKHRIDIARNEVATARAKDRLAAAEVESRNIQEGICPTCGTVLTDESSFVRSNAAEELGAAARLYDDKLREGLYLAAKSGDLQWRVEALNRSVEDIEAECRQKSVAAQTHASWVGQHASWKMRNALAAEQRAAAEVTLASTSERVTVLERHLGAVATEVVTLKAVAGVLGLKGVRAHVLGRALAGIEVVANVWLERIAQRPLKLRLRAYTELKSGSTSDAIGLEIDGAGGGRGYRASSGGERRRVDAALLLALADVSAAAYGRSPGTVFVDEVMDALDAEGIEAVSGALIDLATDRAVVLITHVDALAVRVPAALRLHVAGGIVERR